MYQQRASRQRPTQDEILKWELENPEVAEWINTSKLSFAQSMQQRIREYGFLTDNMMMACRRIMDKAAGQPRPELVLDLSKVKQALDTAHQNGLSSPKLSIDEFIISRAGDQSANPGCLYVKTTEGQYLGKITERNLFVPQRDVPTEVARRVVELGRDPLQRAIEHGKRTGICSCCRRLLTNKVSIEAGIGPICRSKFGW